MIPQIAWPVSNDQFRLVADLFLIWTAAVCLRNDNTLQLNSGSPICGKGDRLSMDLLCSLLAGLFSLLWSSRSGCQLQAAIIIVLSSMALPLLRRLSIRLKLTEALPILELGFPVLVGLTLFNTIGACAKVRFDEFVQWPVPDSTRISIPFYAASILFITRGGTHFVKAVCATGMILPRITPSPQNQSLPSQEFNATVSAVDQVRLGMGRKLGNFERILLLFFVLAHQYEAIGFVLAAKGLIRSKEFEDRDFTEYFLLGSLASILVAILTGEMLSLVTALT
jgi:hypothetical protein